MNQRIFTGYLVINWKNGDIVLRKRSPPATGYWIPVKFKLIISLPETELSIEETLTISPKKLLQVVMEEVTS